MRGTLTTKIKEAIFFVFRNLLESINNKASPEEVLKWKHSEKTKACYKQLFENIENSDETYPLDCRPTQANLPAFLHLFSSDLLF